MIQMAAKTLTTAQLADTLGTNPRTLRKFLRDTTPKESQPGKGARYELKGDAQSIKSMHKKFTNWSNAEEAAKAAKTDKAPKAGAGDEPPAED